MDVEKLFGKLLHEVTGSSNKKLKKYTKGSKKKYKKYKKKKYSGDSHSHKKSSMKDSLVGNLTSQLTSGKGLLTAIGLGVGAYEIYRTKQQSQQALGSPAYQQPVISATTGGSVAPPPPPPPAAARQQTVPQAENIPPAASAHPVVESTSVQPSAPLVVDFDDQELARRLIQVMVGAAHADGSLDAEEEKIILDRLRSVELDQEEKMFLLEELHHPRSIGELTQGINDARLGQTVYAVAASTIVVDTESERHWLDELGAALSLSPELCRFIEESR